MDSSHQNLSVQCGPLSLTPGHRRSSCGMADSSAECSDHSQRAMLMDIRTVVTSEDATLGAGFTGKFTLEELIVLCIHTLFLFYSRVRTSRKKNNTPLITSPASLKQWFPPGGRDRSPPPVGMLWPTWPPALLHAPELHGPVHTSLCLRVPATHTPAPPPPPSLEAT